MATNEATDGLGDPPMGGLVAPAAAGHLVAELGTRCRGPILDEMVSVAVVTPGRVTASGRAVATDRVAVRLHATATGHGAGAETGRVLLGRGTANAHAVAAEVTVAAVPAEGRGRGHGRRVSHAVPCHGARLGRRRPTVRSILLLTRT